MKEFDTESLITPMIVLLLVGSFCLVTFRIAWKRGFFVLPPAEIAVKNVPSGMRVIQALSLFLFNQVIFPSIFLVLWIYWKQGILINPQNYDFSDGFKSWANLGVIGFSFVVMTLFFASLNKPTRDAVWGSSSTTRSFKQNAKDFCLGGATWMLAYPGIIVIGQLLGILITFFYTGAHAEQEAIKHLKEIYGDRPLFVATSIVVITLVPFIEELLFRGFLQSWLSTNFGRSLAIGMTSLIFACFHFSVNQGIENLEFISALFFLSCFLGFVKERQRSLWASIGLHLIFNFISVSFLSFELSS